MVLTLATITESKHKSKGDNEAKKDGKIKARDKNKYSRQAVK
jgi:hypothetical protein